MMQSMQVLQASTGVCQMYVIDIEHDDWFCKLLTPHTHCHFFLDVQQTLAACLSAAASFQGHMKQLQPC